MPVPRIEIVAAALTRDLAGRGLIFPFYTHIEIFNFIDLIF